MRNKYRTLILFTVAITMIAITKTVYAQRIDPVSVYYPQLQEYLRIAAEENPELRSLWHQYRSELEVIPQVGTLPDPRSEERRVGKGGGARSAGGDVKRST